MPEPKLYMDPSRDGNKQYINVDSDRQGNVTIDYTMMQTSTANGEGRGMEVPLFSKNISISYNINELEKGINITHSVEPNSRSLRSYQRVSEDYLKKTGKNINDRFSSLKVNGNVVDKYNQNVNDTIFTLEDTITTMKDVPQALINKGYSNELDKVCFSDIVSYLEDKKNKLYAPETNVIEMPQTKPPMEYNLGFVVN